MISKFSYLATSLNPSRIRLSFLHSFMAYPNFSATIFEGKNKAPRTVLLQHGCRLFAPENLEKPSAYHSQSSYASQSNPSKRIYDHKQGAICLRFVDPSPPNLAKLLNQNAYICERLGHYLLIIMKQVQN
jgi:hypothetical protein